MLTFEEADSTFVDPPSTGVAAPETTVEESPPTASGVGMDLEAELEAAFDEVMAADETPKMDSAGSEILVDIHAMFMDPVTEQHVELGRASVTAPTPSRVRVLPAPRQRRVEKHSGSKRCPRKH